MRATLGVGVAKSREQQDAYLEQARDADARAARATDPVIKEGWAKVAEGYRYLARRLEHARKGSEKD